MHKACRGLGTEDARSRAANVLISLGALLEHRERGSGVNGGETNGLDTSTERREERHAGRLGLRAAFCRVDAFPPDAPPSFLPRRRSAAAGFASPSSGASAAAFDDLGRAPLHDACWSATPDFALIDTLLAADATVLFRADSRGHCPLDFAPRDTWGSWSEVSVRPLPTPSLPFPHPPFVFPQMCLFFPRSPSSGTRPGILARPPRVRRASSPSHP